MRDEDVQKMCLKYCGNEMANLKKICDQIIRSTFGSAIADFEYDDFYSMANLTVWKAAMMFNEEINDSFDNYVRRCITNRFKSMMSKKNRKKRIPVKNCVSIDSELSYDSDKTYADIIDSGYDITDDIEELQDNGLETFIEGLSSKQKQIVELIIQDYDKNDIKAKLNMSEKRYNICVDEMRRFENRILLERI